MSSPEPRQLRRPFVSTSATPLASLEFGGLLSPNDSLARPRKATGELALNRPVTSRSEAYNR
jgi:hypothetical protein